MAASADTIVAAATPSGRGGVAIVRISGPMVPELAQTLLGGMPRERYAHFARWHDKAGVQIDLGLALYFPAPASFTGEHVLELQGHGGNVVVEALIERVVELGARRARPGEFSERAFLNEKIDLAQAEAIADLIDAGSRRAAQAAMRSLQGEFSARVNSVRAALTALRVYVEAAIDFPEEEIDFLGSQEVRERVTDVQRGLADVLRAAEQGALLTRGITVAIAGRPNAGKSTLMNALAGHEVAIVTPVAGTTRDLLRERVQVDGVAIELIDTAGLREVAGASPHEDIEAEGIRRAREAIRKADHVLFVVDAATDPSAQAFEQERGTLPEGVPVTVLLNKSDLAPASMPDALAFAGADAPAPGAATKRLGNRTSPYAVLAVSARSGAGLPQLHAHLAALAGAESGEGAFSARARHVEALRRAVQHLDAAIAQLQVKQGELAALELREAQRALGEIVGDVTSDELLGRIFSSFCIGK